MKLPFILGVFLVLGLACRSSEEEVLAKAGNLKTQKVESCLPDVVEIQTDSLATFSIQRTPVTVGLFEQFVEASGYTTQAETFGNSGVFDYEDKSWKLIEGAYFKQPFGKTDGDAPADHPATQVSYYDASAYCAFYGMRLPTEREWEAAARFKQPTGTSMYPWGDEMKSDGASFRANVWQGLFPHVLKVEDGYAYTSPVEAYPAAPSGLRDMAGNVWEWVSDTIGGVRLPGDDTHRLAKGGSFLCEPNWCHGYLISGSTNISSETGLFHTGFRCVCEEK